MSSHLDIEQYLGQLNRLLAGTRIRERLVTEMRDHLEQALEDGVAAGMPRDEAAAEAIRRSGSPAAVAARAKPDVPVIISAGDRKLHVLLLAGYAGLAVLNTATGRFSWHHRDRVTDVDRCCLGGPIGSP